MGIAILLLEDFILQQKEQLKGTTERWKQSKFVNEKQEALYIRASNNIQDAINEAEEAKEILQKHYEEKK